jgi:hypothetical protein
MPEKRSHLQVDTDISAGWTTVHKISFRFFFSFFALTTLFGDNIFSELFYPEFWIWTRWTSVFSRPLYFLDRHFFRIGYVPDTRNPIILSDKPVGWVLLLAIFCLSVLATLTWSFADRRRKNYVALNFWFRWYLAYYLFIALDFYAVFKMTLAQIPFPNADVLLAPFGRNTRESLFFNTIGVSPVYSILTGAFEFIAAVLLLNRKTRVLGCVLMAAALINVACLNLCYNIDVKLMSLLLLAIDVYLLAPYLPRIFKFFYSSEAVAMPASPYIPKGGWRTTLVNVLILLTACWVTLDLVIRSNRIKDQLHAEKQKYYEVQTIQGNDTTSATLTDSMRIKNILFTAWYAHKYAVACDARDSMTYYDYTWDYQQRCIRLTPWQKTNPVAELSFGLLPNNRMKVAGNYRGRNIEMIWEEKALPDLPLLKEKFRWVQKK